MAGKKSLSARIREYQNMHPEASTKDIAAKLNTTAGYIYAVRNNDKKKAKLKQQWKVVHVATSDNSIEKAMEIEIPITMEEPEADPVNHPSHYKYGGIETIDFIEAKELGYNLGNVVKYITRSDHKGNRKEDLLKAQWYLNREIASL
jgi:hypothetical protein